VTPRAATRPGERKWTTRDLLDWLSEAFAKEGLDSPRLSAELLVAHVLGCERLRLYMDVDRPASPLERQALRDLTARALAHEPVQYLVGEAWFFSLPFHVDKRVLIPRPSTETLVELVLQHARSEPGFDRATIADIGVGSGAIVIALLKNLPQARAVAVDISADALDVARANAERHGVLDRLELVEGTLLAPLGGHPLGRDLHYLVANPPYIPDHEWADVPRNVKEHEPERALRAGVDGLEFVRPLIEEGPKRLRPGGLLLVEIAASTADDVRVIAEGHPLFENVRIERDLEGHPRVLVARRAANSSSA